MDVTDLYISSTSPNHHRHSNMSPTSGTSNRSSFFGSIRKLGRSSSSKMGRLDQVNSANLAMGNNTSTTRSDNPLNPFRDPAPATRRPREYLIHFPPNSDPWTAQSSVPSTPYLLLKLHPESLAGLGYRHGSQANARQPPMPLHPPTSKRSPGPTPVPEPVPARPLRRLLVHLRYQSAPTCSPRKKTLMRSSQPSTPCS